MVCRSTIRLRQGLQTMYRTQSSSSKLLSSQASAKFHIPEGAYLQEYEASLKDPSQYWLQQARTLLPSNAWFQTPSKGYSEADPVGQWFEDGELNMCYLALDLHVNSGRGQQLALVYDSPVTDQVKYYTYNQLLREVSKFAAVLTNMGVKKGDTVVVYMPMIPEAIVSILACARIGATHSVVFGGFAPRELYTRIRDANPALVVTASCGVEVNQTIPYKPLLDQALEFAVADHTSSSSSSSSPKVIVVNRPQYDCTKQMKSQRDYFYHDLMQNHATSSSITPPVPVPSTHPLYILYTSGTTGKPKGVVRDTGGYAVALKYSLTKLMNTQPGQVYWAASDIGWVVGHSFIVYGPLINGCTTVLYEGKPVRTPDAGAIWRVIEQHHVNSMFIAPTAFRAVKKEDPHAELMSRYNISSLNSLFVAGERLDPPTYDWLHSILPRSVNVVDNWWQTETGWPICTNPLGIQNFRVKAGSCTLPVPGYDLQVLHEDGSQCAPDQVGDLVMKLPCPPGFTPSLWRDLSRFRSAYFTRYPGYYLAGDSGFRDRQGYVYVMGRIDDVINVAGHRLSTGEMEEVVASHKAVAECAVVGIDDKIKGEIPVGFIVLKDGTELSEQEVARELVALVRRDIGPVAALKTVIVVPRLPKTRSGKILRKTIRDLSAKRDVATPATIDDPAIMEEIRAKLELHQVGPLFARPE